MRAPAKFSDHKAFGPYDKSQLNEIPSWGGKAAISAQMLS